MTVRKGRRPNKEKVYDEQISPLMKQIIQICNDNKINFYADFSIGKYQTDSCSTIVNEFEGGYSKYTLMNFIRQVALKNGFNIDDFLVKVYKTYPHNESSYYMDKLFENGSWRRKEENENKES